MGWWTKLKEKIKQTAPIAKWVAPAPVAKGIEIAEKVLEAEDKIEKEIRKPKEKK